MATDLPIPHDYGRHMPATDYSKAEPKAELPPLSNDEDDITELEDGSVMIALEDAVEDAPATDARFDENLVNVIDRTVLNRMARQLLG